jgi:hypothetical protein
LSHKLGIITSRIEISRHAKYRLQLGSEAWRAQAAHLFHHEKKKSNKKSYISVTKDCLELN